METQNMTKRTTLALTLFTASLFASSAALACDAMGKSTHMGQLMSVDAKQKTFTIRDAQSQSPVTFTANNEILAGLKEASGSIMVNYEEEDGGSLNAVGVTF
jgi:hypothetical protein